VAREVGEEVAAKVGYSFLAQLYTVDDAAARKVFAEQIALGDLAGVEAKLAIAREAKKEGRGGRRPKPEVDVAVAEIERVYRKWKRAGAFEPENLAGMRAAALPVAKRTRRLSTELAEVAGGLEEEGSRRR